MDENAQPTRWRVARDDLSERMRAALDEFVARRLLITDTHQGIATITVAHEAFLIAWNPLARAIAEEGAALRMRPQVEQAAQQWRRSGRAKVNLWEGNQLARAVADTGARPHSPLGVIPLGQRVLVTDMVGLTGDAREFLHASIARERFGRTRVVAILAGFLSLALVAAGLAILGQRNAENQRRVATAHGLVAKADSIRDHDPRTALRLGIAAQQIVADEQTRAGLLSTLIDTTIIASLTGHGDDVVTVAWSPDGHTLATVSYDDALILWDFTDRNQPRRLGNPLTGHTTAGWEGWDIPSVAWSPDGRTLASSHDKTVTLWDVTSPDRPRRLDQPLTDHTDGVWSMALRVFEVGRD